MYEKNSRSWVKHLDFNVLDLIVITFSFWTAFFIRLNMSGLSDEQSYRGLYLIFVLFHLILVFFFQTYSNVIRRSYLEEIGSVLKQNAFLIACVFSYLVFTRQSTTFSRLILGYFIVIDIPVMIISHFVLKKVVRHRMQRLDRISRLCILTERAFADRCIDRVKSDFYQGFALSGIFLIANNEDDDSETKVEQYEGVRVLGTQEDLLEYVRLNVVDQILICSDIIDRPIRDIIEQLFNMGVVVHFSMEQFESMPNKQITKLGKMSVITTCFKTASTFQLFLKRCMDIAGALVGLLITGIAFVFVAPIIFIKSPGPIFFSQNRVGKNGRKFRIYKFRSMYMDAEERKKELMAQNKMQGLMFKMDNDPRIIKGIGHYIRNTSIDELPQFWNILKGDMSLVGTRPPTVDEFEHYSYHHKIRLSFRPGLTGMWQVSGRSDITDFEEIVRLDEKYIAEWSIWLDIRIILKTVEVVLLRKGSV